MLPVGLRYAIYLLFCVLLLIPVSSPELVKDSTCNVSVYLACVGPRPFQNLPILQPKLIFTSFLTLHFQFIYCSTAPAAVGLGIMSWVLLADDGDEMHTTGTVMTMKNGAEALVVIFALKEALFSFCLTCLTHFFILDTTYVKSISITHAQNMGSPAPSGSI